MAGGAEVFMNEIFQRVAAKGHKVTLLCGAYAGAVLSDREGCWSSLNLRLTDLEVDQATASYGAEETSERVTRRKRVWTPTEFGGI